MSTLVLLKDELSWLDAVDVVIQAYVNDNDIRQDGMLRASSRPAKPGIILSFSSKHGPLSYPCDSCDDWQHNLRSIALALQALRSVDRYGVTKRAEQYKGWAKLPAPDSLREFKSKAHADEFLSHLLGLEADLSVPFSKNELQRAKVLGHPDSGGSAYQFKMVMAAIELLGLDN